MTQEEKPISQGSVYYMESIPERRLQEYRSAWAAEVRKMADMRGPRPVRPTGDAP